LTTFKTGARNGEFSLVLVCLLLTSWPVSATHELDHRYAVQGYVLDDQKKPRPGLSVSLRKNNRSLGQSITDSRGYFSIEAHLHDADIGRVLELRAGNSRGEIRMQATRGDQSTRRVHLVNFIGANLVEDELDPGGVPPWLYPVGGAVSVLAVVVFVLRGRKKKPKAAPADDQKAESKKRKKRNKNKKRNS